ncbi:hypothetical protein N7520_011128 [Penicillium odoratum]|uniref:uncharacterized protein n=1 Tax=Penicillium odoratum TaxID=1167516 RepID=UPI00254817CC|nr:uncharacterized protein N7520_011128 [Penicillium odoratum]KAJ5745946.1 hypothetical protein N7520_011128 [Penicillium odoratum]
MSDPRDYNVGWICCNATEFTAAQAFLDEEHLPPKNLPSHDQNSYVLGKIRKHNVVISILSPDYSTHPTDDYTSPTDDSTSPTAQATAYMLQSFPNVRFNMMVGISGGAPSPQHDIRLGDIVVGIDGGIELDSGKLTQHQSLPQMGVPDRPSTFLRVAITKLQTQHDLNGSRLEKAVDEVLERYPNLRKDYQRPNEDSDRLYHSQVIHPPGSGSICAEVCGNDTTALVLRNSRDKDKADLVVHYGGIASTNVILKDAIIRDKLSADMDVLCFQMEAAGVTSQFPCLMIRGICDYSDSHQNKQWQGYAAMVAAAYARDLLHWIVPLRVEREERDLEDLDLNLALEKLPLATGAEYRPYMDQDDVCLPGRTELLGQIKEWSFSLDERSIFWLNGLPETGKSTISRTLAQSLKNSKNLGASFFFKRGDGDRGNAKKFVSTLARQLVLEFPDLIVGVQKALREDPGVASKSLEQQFEKLLLQPLLQLKQLNRKPQVTVIVIDALDECGNHQDILRIIRLLPHLDSIGAVRFRIFVTSQPTYAITSSFSERSSTSYQEFSLHQIPKTLLEHDMRLFLESRFADIRLDKNISQDWPGVDAIHTLVKSSVPFSSFILAVQVCRVLGQPRVNAVGTLAKIISWLSENSKLHGIEITKSLAVVQQDFDEMINKSIIWERQESGGRETEDSHKDSLCDPSDIESIFSTESILSSHSSQSEITSIAISELTNLLLNDDDLKSLYPIAISKVGPGKFQRNFARMLKRYGQKLNSEASSEVQRQAANFVRLSARRTSALIRIFLTQDSGLPIQRKLELDVSKSAQVGAWITSQMEVSSNLNDDANEISSDSDSTSSESDHRSSLGTIEEVKEFMVSTRAFRALRQELREWLEVKRKNSQENEGFLSVQGNKAQSIMRGLNVSTRTSIIHFR